jgi:hypothetical protein
MKWFQCPHCNRLHRPLSDVATVICTDPLRPGDEVELQPCAKPDCQMLSPVNNRNHPSQFANPNNHDQIQI